MARKRLVLKFPTRLVEQPVVCRLVKRFDLDFNILKAQVTPKQQGLLVLELSGENGNCIAAEEYLKSLGVIVQPLSKDIVKDDAKCTDCGACVGVCPTGALSIDETTRKIVFDKEQCIACELCIGACPVRAMALNF